jgi:hypothetical protein
MATSAFESSSADNISNLLLLLLLVSLPLLPLERWGGGLPHSEAPITS